jgi:hypothetical protein
MTDRDENSALFSKKASIDQPDKPVTGFWTMSRSSSGRAPEPSLVILLSIARSR